MSNPNIFYSAFDGFPRSRRSSQDARISEISRMPRISRTPGKFTGFKDSTISRISRIVRISQRLLFARACCIIRFSGCQTRNSSR